FGDGRPRLPALVREPREADRDDRRAEHPLDDRERIGLEWLDLDRPVRDRQGGGVRPFSYEDLWPVDATDEGDHAPGRRGRWFAHGGPSKRRPGGLYPAG